MRNLIRRFWAWYEKFYAWNVSITAVLFVFQLVHLYWLTTAVVIFRIFGTSFFFSNSKVLTLLMVLADYTEIPAIIMTSILYTRKIRREGGGVKNILYLIFLNIQWIHLFWITDEVALNALGLGSVSAPLNPALAWVAILIDYLELPVIVDTIREVFRVRSLKMALEVIRSKD